MVLHIDFSQYLYQRQFFSFLLGICPPAYTGTFCELAFDPCQNNDNECPKNECYRDPANMEHGYYCNCDKGYVFKLNSNNAKPSCEKINTCPSPCLNNATCVKTGAGYKCKCVDASYFGDRCEYHSTDLMNSEWSEWEKWGDCIAHESSQECIQVSTRHCKNTKCYGASKRHRICAHMASLGSKCDVNDARMGLFSDFFVIYEYFANLTGSSS